MGRLIIEAISCSTKSNWFSMACDRLWAHTTVPIPDNYWDSRPASFWGYTMEPLTCSNVLRSEGILLQSKPGPHRALSLTNQNDFMPLPVKICTAPPRATMWHKWRPPTPAPTADTACWPLLRLAKPGCGLRIHLSAVLQTTNQPLKCGTWNKQVNNKMTVLFH